MVKSCLQNSLKTAGMILIAITWLANSSNPPDASTGAPFDGKCNNCHGGNNANGYSGTVTLSGLPNPIVLGQVYPLTLTMSSTNPNSTPAGGGFQLVAVDGNDNNAGTWLAPVNSGTGIDLANGRSYMEHRGPKDFSGANSSISWDFQWTAPASAAGNTIKFYYSGNFVNGGSTSGDFPVARVEQFAFGGSPAPLQVLIQPLTPISCFGGSNGALTAIATGGTPPFSYQWSNGQSGTVAPLLSAGVYTVTVTGGGTQTATFSLTQPAPLSVSSAASNVLTCQNPTATLQVNVQGGTPPYQFTGLPSTVVTTPGTYNFTVTDAIGCTQNSSVTVNSDLQIPAVYVIGDDSLSCTTTSVNIYAITNGTNNLMYQWQGPAIISSGITPDETVNEPGTYTVTVTNLVNGCTNSASIVVGEWPPVIASIIPTATPLCFGDSTGGLMVQHVQGRAPFTYIWSSGDTLPELEGLSAGTYAVNVTDLNNCTTTANFQINEPPFLNVQLQVSNVTGGNSSDGSIQAIVNGGTPPYSYAWSTNSNSFSIDSLTAGTYTVTVTDFFECTVQITAIVNPFDCVFAPVLQITPVTCWGQQNGQIAVMFDTTQTNTPINYEWSNGSSDSLLTQLGTGLYTVKITDATNCPVVLSAGVTQPTELTSDFAVVNDTNGAGIGSIDATLSGGTPPYSFYWTKNGVTFSFTEDLDFLEAGIYTFTLIDSLDCIFQSEPITIENQLVNIVENASIPVLRVYPNPTDQFLQLDLSTAASFELVLYDMLGQSVLNTTKPNCTSTLLSLDGLLPGHYRLMIREHHGTWLRVLPVILR
jgi:SprB repeat